MSSLGPAPGLAPPAAGVPAWRVTLFLSFPLYPRKCPIAGHLHGAASLFLAQPLILYVFWLNHPAWRGFPEPTASARVPLCFSPGSLPAVVPALPSCLSPAHWLAALQPSPLSAVSLAVDLTLVAGACFPLPQLPKESCPGKRSPPSTRSRVFQVWGADELGVQGREEAQRGRSRAGCHPCPRDEREPPAQGLGTDGWKQKNEKEEKSGE